MRDTDPASLNAGFLFHGHYQLVRPIKAGGMGAVYEVIHVATRRRRALKVMKPDFVSDAGMRARFKLEATVAADIESEHIVEVFDAGVDEATGFPFLVMELLRGEDLGALLARRLILPGSEVVALLRQVALALNRTHDAGIVHRDLKPENLFLSTRDDGAPRVKVLDFGVAKVVAQSPESMKTTESIGTPLYMSPEQIRGDGSMGPASDLYALAHIAYTLLVGEAYWAEEARTNAVGSFLWKVMEGAKEPASVRSARRGVWLSPQMDVWFAKATAAVPQQRFGAASDLVEALATALNLPSEPSQGFTMAGSLPALSHPTSPPALTAPLPQNDSQAAVVTDKVPPKKKRRGFVLWLSVLSTLILLTVVFLSLREIAFWGLLTPMPDSVLPLPVPVLPVLETDAGIPIEAPAPTASTAPSSAPSSVPVPSVQPAPIPKADSTSKPPSKPAATSKGKETPTTTSSKGGNPPMMDKN